jgi:plastocyanin
MNTFRAISISLTLGVAVAACGGSPTRATGPSAVTPPMPFDISFTLPDAHKKLPKNTIGEELPSEGVGSKTDPTWGMVGGFTQTRKAQVLAFPPGVTITIRNLTTNDEHTLNVVGRARKPPAHFPANPSLTFSARGGGKFGIGYASGIINAGQTVKAKLVKAGTYLIGCAFHYDEGMRDVVIVKAGATPGPDFQR